jgi:hypothetical protein
MDIEKHEWPHHEIARIICFPFFASVVACQSANEKCAALAENRRSSGQNRPRACYFIIFCIRHTPLSLTLGSPPLCMQHTASGIMARRRGLSSSFVVVLAFFISLLSAPATGQTCDQPNTGTNCTFPEQLLPCSGTSDCCCKYTDGFVSIAAERKRGGVARRRKRGALKLFVCFLLS